jgi:hypothetical protein
MRRCKVHLENITGSSYSQSFKHDEPKLDREDHHDYDVRTWKLHCTVNAAGQVCIPSMAFKQAIDSAAYKLGMKVPGRRGATFKNFFASGFLCEDHMPIANGEGAWTRDNAGMIKINSNATGKRGSGARVPRLFPVFHEWHGVVTFTIVDDVITREVFETHVKAAGMIVGIGRFRPENGGVNGRFKPVQFEWEDINF